MPDDVADDQAAPAAAVDSPPPQSGVLDNASKKSVARNAMVSYGALAVSLASGFVATPIILQELGETQYGTYAVVGGLVGYLAIADAGVGTATTNRVARAQAAGDGAGLRVLLGTSFWLFCAASSVLTGMALLIGSQLGTWFSIPADLETAAQRTLLILAAGQAIGLPLSLYGQVLVGAGRSDVTAVRTMIFSTISSVAQVVVALNGGGLVGLATVSMVIGLVGLGFLRAQVRRMFPAASISPRQASKRVARELIRVGSKNVVISVAGMLSFSSDVTILAAIGPISAVAAYAVASRLVGYVRLLSSRLTDVLMPVYAHGEALGDNERQYRTAVLSTRLSLVIALPLTAACVAFGDGLLESWLGDVPEDAYDVLVLLALCSLAQLPGHNCFVLLTATERTGALLRLSICAAIVNVSLSILLTLEVGIIGPALASLVVIMVADVILLPLLVCREFHWGLGVMAKDIMRPLGWPLALVVGSAAALVVLPGTLPLEAVLHSALVCFIFWSAAYRTLLDAPQRQRVRQLSFARWQALRKPR